MTYRPSDIEPKRQRAWREANRFATPAAEQGRTDTYVFASLPFTSGEAHLGHVRSYAIADAYARFRRARGDAVLFSLGFDAFGLPSELGAIERGQSPAEWVEQCVARMREQFDRLGFSFDWSRSFVTSEAEMYRWSQWLFLRLYEADLVFQREAYVDWCKSCGTALAAGQVVEGCCWRCHNQTTLVRRPQWYLRHSTYNEENERRLEQLPWNDLAIAAQRSLLGRVDGVEFEAHSPNDVPLTVFTTHPDAIPEASFVALSPRHPELGAWLGGEGDKRKLGALLGSIDRADRRAEGVTMVETESIAHVYGVEQPLPVVVSPAVDARYGPTAALGIPSLDRTDAAIAARLEPPSGLTWEFAAKPLLKAPAVRYRASDFSISRQRAWGAPVPIVHCEECGVVPVPFEELPVRLPENLTVTGEGRPLAEDAGFLRCRCPSCEGEARREANTLDCHMDMCCVYMAAAVPRADRGENLVRHPELRRWLPVTQAVRGADTGGFVLDERTATKALRDLGEIDFLPEGEPFGPTLAHGMVRMNGRKMSKHLGNSVVPQALVEEVGADALRFAVLYAAAPAKDIAWDPTVLSEARRFLDRLWTYAEPRLRDRDPEPAIEATTRLRRKLKSWCDTASERVGENYEALDMHRATRNAMTLLDRIVDFERKVLASGAELSRANRSAIVAALLLELKLLAPLCPHVAEELWELAGQDVPLEAPP
jgi:leucyl-tRNA synthetase